jgi:CRISPR-associated protein Cmr6
MPGESAGPRAPAVRTCPWVDEQIAVLVGKNNAKADEILRGRQLAEAWQAIEDASLKAAALADIERRWRERGWWETPPGKSAKQARAAYESKPP